MAADGKHVDVKHVLKLDVPIAVLLAEKTMNVEDIVDLAPGTVITFDKQYEEPLDLLANGRKIGSGVAVKVNENFGIQIKEMKPREDTIRALG
ncbi:MAG: FliM/FliN family flagellar motor switch protein [Planctomycetaceae bacterium]|nr:FliM/FliN family flagellar motor switch protein [Planctomycetaceae bacterium]